MSCVLPLVLQMVPPSRLRMSLLKRQFPRDWEHLNTIFLTLDNMYRIEHILQAEGSKARSFQHSACLKQDAWEFCAFAQSLHSLIFITIVY